MQRTLSTSTVKSGGGTFNHEYLSMKIHGVPGLRAESAPPEPAHSARHHRSRTVQEAVGPRGKVCGIAFVTVLDKLPTKLLSRDY